MGIGALLWILFLVRYSECTCTLPTNLVGSWTSSEQGSMTFTSTSLLSYPTTTFGTFTFTCDSYSGSQFVLKPPSITNEYLNDETTVWCREVHFDITYPLPKVLRSPSFTYLTLSFEAYLCLVLTEISSTKFTYFIGTETNSNAGNDRLKTSNPSTTLNVSDVCDRSSYPIGTYFVLVKDGEINSAQTDCPTDLLGQWTYTYNNGSGSDVCSGNTTSADVCNTTTGISLSYTSCSQMVMYSSSGFLYCLYSFTDSSMTYINLYNTDSTTDESSTYRFTCLVMTESGDDRYITQYPKQCHENQNSSSVLSPGTSLVFSLSSTCATSDVVSAATLAVALAVVIPLIVIIVACIISYFCWVNYQKKKIEEAARPDPKFANGEIRNRRKNIHDGVIHPDQNGIMIRREESIVISVPLSARDDDNQSPLSELEDYGQDVDSDDDEYEVKDITEFSLTDDIPEIVVHSATPNPRDANPVETGTDVKSAKIKKKRRRRRKSARSRVSTITESRQDSDIKTKRKSHSHMKKSHLNTKDKITFGTSTVLLKMPVKRQKKKKKYLAMNEEGKDGLPDVDEKEKVAPSDKPTVKEESLREKAYKMRMKKGETLADLIKKKKKVPILKHPMESSYQDLPNGKPPTSSWGSRRGTTPKTAPSLIQVEQADINDDSMVMFRRAITDLELKPQESSRVKVPEKVTFFEPSKPGGDLWKQMRGMWNLASHAISNPNVGSSSALQSAKKKKKGKVRKIQI